MNHTKPLSGYLTKTKSGGGLVFTGESCTVRVPQRYEVQGLYMRENLVSSLCIFEVIVSGEEVPYHLVLPAIVELDPSDIAQQKVDDTTYHLLKFKKGDTFIASRDIIRREHILAAMFIEFVRNGNMPSFVSYPQMTHVFDVAQKTTGVKLPISHATLEMIIAHCCRKNGDLSVKYRHTDMKEPPVFLGLRNTTNIKDSTTAKLTSSYIMDGINSSIVNPSTQVSEIENILRS